ncbi:hypothetical protein HA414_15965 [Klebsiella pneumoniae]|nr:hypothetical protein [Klebsiella pneumoniae]EIW8629054.1 hypothetical protein [Klebsiella pneumoniae]MBD1052839.1 hypothetical protein [Klebsiella pneumoniae]HBY5156746.1 hypothetical protein [Klebsiella pneumoniae]
MGENPLDKVIQTFHMHALNREVILQGAQHIKVKAIFLFKFPIVVFQVIQIIHNLRIKMAINRRGAKKQDGSKAFLCGNGHQVDYFIVGRQTCTASGSAILRSRNPFFTVKSMLLGE